jgi:hypothetical protein
MDFRAGAHPDEDSLEKYILGSLDQHDAEQIDEHLLTCQMCREKTTAVKDYIRAMRKALETGPPKAKAARKGKPPISPCVRLLKVASFQRITSAPPASLPVRIRTPRQWAFDGDLPGHDYYSSCSEYNPITSSATPSTSPSSPAHSASRRSESTPRFCPNALSCEVAGVFTATVSRVAGPGA